LPDALKDIGFPLSLGMREGGAAGCMLRLPRTFWTVSDRRRAEHATFLKRALCNRRPKRYHGADMAKVPIGGG
jgi:hypothetical protein